MTRERDISRVTAINHMRKIFPESCVVAQEETIFYNHSNRVEHTRKVYTERLGNMWSASCETYKEAIQDILRKKEQYEKQTQQEND